MWKIKDVSLKYWDILGLSFSKQPESDLSVWLRYLFKARFVICGAKNN